MFRLLLAGSLFLSVTICKSGTFTSRGDGVTAPWTSASSWVFTGDADGIPDADDNVTILSSETITWNANISCNNLTVNGVLHHNTASTVRTLYIYGNYILNGSEAGSGAYSFQGSGNSISGTGSFNAYTRWTISANTTIQSNVVATKMYAVKFYGGADVTNFGNITLTSTAEYAPGSVWINGTGSTLTIRTGDIMTNGTLDVSSNVNTFSPNYTIGADIVPATFNNTCHHFVIGGNKPVRLSTNMQVNGNMTLQSGALFSTNGNDLSIRGNYQKTSSSGSFTMLAGDILTFNGSTAQTIATVGPQTLSNLVINNTGSSVSITTGNAFTITESLSLVNGTFNLSHASATMTLVSNASSTAIIGPSPNGVMGTGNLRLQRFISARSAGFSDMAGCVQSQTFADWGDELLIVYGYSPPSVYPSAWGYNESIWDYVPVTSSAQALTPGVGFEVYLDSDGGQTTFNNTTVINTGRPNLGSFNMASYITANNDGWNLVGNPYHANISWDALHATTTNISPDIMFYDETFEDFTTVTTGSGQLIAPNQGFWVLSSGGETFTFTEAIKSSSLSSTFRSSSLPLFTIRLKSVGGTRFTSGTSFRFANEPALAEKGSLPFKGVPHPMAPTLKSVDGNGKNLKVNLLNSSQEEITVPLHFTVGEDGLYTLEAQNIESMQIENYSCALLVDNKTGRTTNLVKENYQFYAEKSRDENRFSLRLIKNADCGTSTQIEVSNGLVDINRLGENTLVKLNFGEETTATITMTDLLGQALVPAQTLTTASETVYLPVPANFSGIYLVNVFYNGRVESKKLFR